MSRTHAHRTDQSERAAELRRQRLRDAQQAAEQRRQKLLQDVADLAAASRDNPSQVGEYVSELAAAGLLTPGDEERIHNHVATLAGPEFAEQAFMPSVAEREAESEALLGALVDEWAGARRRIERGRSGNVIDVDVKRAQKTMALVQRIAGFLGLPERDVQVRADEVAAQKTAARGARGLMDGGVVYLHPDRYDPDTTAGRALLGHEMVHVAQRPEHLSRTAPVSKAGAEREAAQLGQQFAAGQSIGKPQFALPAMDKAADNDNANANANANSGDGGGGGPPSDFRLTLAGQRFRIRIPSGSSPGRVRVQSLSIGVGPLTITEAELRFNSDWSFDEGSIKANVSAGEGINIENVELDVNSRKEVEATLTNVEVQLGSYIQATMDLTIGTRGVSGTATILPSDVNLPGGISFTGGQIDLTVADGALSASGTVTATMAGVGELSLAASFEQGGEDGGSAVSGTVDITLEENLQIIDGVTLSSATISGSYSEENGVEASGDVTINLRDWATAAIDVGYTRPNSEGGEQWRANGRLDQSQPLTIGDGENQVTVTEGFVEFAYDNGQLEPLTAGANLDHQHFTGRLDGTYDVAANEFGGTAEVNLKEGGLTLGDSGVELKALSGSATVEANALTVITVTQLEAEIPYEEQPTFKATGTNLTYRVPESLLSGAGQVNTMRELTFGSTEGIHGKIAEGAQASVTLTDNVITAVNSGIEYTVHEGTKALGHGRLDLNFANENGQESVSGEGSFTLDDDLGFPDRALGPVKILTGSSIKAVVADGQLTEISIEDVTFTVTNWTGQPGEVQGSFTEGTWNAQTGMLTVAGRAAVTQPWKFAAGWGEVEFQEGGDFGVSVGDNELQNFDGQLPFKSEITIRETTAKIEGSLDGKYTKEDGNFNGSLDATLKNDLTFQVGAEKLVIKKDVTTVGAEVEGSGLTTLTGTLGAEYHDAKGLLVEGSVTDATLDVATGNVGFQAKLTLKQRIEEPLTGEGVWKVVVLPDVTTIDITVEESALTRAGGSIQLELHEGETPWLRGALNNAEYKVSEGKFSGDLSLELISPFEFPRKETADALPPGLSLTVKEGSTVSGRIEENSFSNATVKLNFDVKKSGQPLAEGSIDGSWDLDADEVTGTGTFDLIDDLVLGEGSGQEEPSAWTLTIESGAGIAVSIGANVLQEATIDIPMKLKEGETEVASGSINGQYKIGDDKGFTGSIEIDMSTDYQIGTASRFGIFIGEATHVSGRTENGVVKEATGDFVLVAKEGEDKAMSLTLNTTYTEGADFEGTASIEVHRPILMGESGEYKWFIDPDTNGNVAIQGSEPKAIDGDITLRVAKNDVDFAKATISVDYDFSQGAEAVVNGLGSIELIGDLELGTAAGYTFTLSGGSGVTVSVTNNELDWIDGTLTVKMGDPEQFGELTLTGKYDATLEEPKFDGEASLNISRSLDLNFEAGGFHFYLEPSTITVTMTDSEISAASGQIVFKADQVGGGENEEVLGSIVVTLQGDYAKEGESGTFNGTGTATLTGNITVGSAGGYEVVVMTGTEVEIEVADNEFTRISGTLNGQVNNLETQSGEDREFIGFNCEVTYRTADGGSIDVNGSCQLLGRKKVFAVAGYEFWLRRGEGPTATIEIVENKLIQVGGTVSCEVRDDKPEPLIIANATGTYVQETGLFSGEGDIKLGRNETYPPDSTGFRLVFYKDSGGGGRVVDSKIEELTGQLKVDVILEDGPLVQLDASGRYNAVKNEIVELEGSAKLLRPIEIGGEGENAFLRIEELEGTGRIENNELVQASGHCRVVVPKLNNLTGEFDVNWRSENGQDKFSGSGWIDFTLIDEPENHRSLGGRVNGDYKEDGTFKIWGDADYQLNEHIGGKLTVEVDQNLDPILGGTFTVSDVPLVEGRDIFGMDVDLFQINQTVMAGPVPIAITGGAAFGMKLSMQDLTFGTSITVANWHPLQGNLPDIPEARLDLNTGLSLQAALKPWFAVGIGLGGVASAGISLQGELALITDLNLNPYALVRAMDGVWSGELGINLEIVGSAQLSITPQLYAELVGERWPYDLDTWTLDLGDLFSYEWNGSYPFGDASVSTAATQGGAEGGDGPQDVSVPQQAVEEQTSRPAMNDMAATNRGSQVSGGADMDSLDTEPEQGEASELQQKLQEAQEMAEKVGRIANVGGTLFNAISIMFTAPVPPPFGAAAAGVYMVYKHITGECTFGDIKQAAIDLWDMAQEFGLMDYITSLIPETIVNLYNQIKDKGLQEVTEDLVRNMGDWLRAEFSDWTRVVDAVEDALIDAIDSIGTLVSGLINGNLSLDTFLEIAATLGAAVGEIALAVAEELGEEALELLGSAAEAAGAAGRWIASAAGDALGALADLAGDALDAVGSVMPWNW